MHDLQRRIREAETHWQQGDAALAAGDRTRAYRNYTAAHDAIVDCPRLHLTAHQKLRQVSRGTEYLTDRVLIALAPLGVFEWIARAMHSTVRLEALCRRAISH